jgi:ABC-type bacteriocin/lantibiotic exporter with double-glycine peptidase domain
MNLEGHTVKLEDVKKLVPLDPIQGCSMETLINAAAKLGFALEVRFVKPEDISRLPRPFILHGITSQEKHLGHFLVVADFDPKKRNFALIDPIRETFGWNPESSLLYGYSGYVLVPKHPFIWQWNLFAGVSLILCGFACFLLLYRRYRTT